jgi:hypothetical protein
MGGTPWPIPDGAPDEIRALHDAYADLRRACSKLEKRIGKVDLSEKELKRLDKAITTMKVGFKIAKKVIRKRAVAMPERRRLAVVT